RRYRSGENRYLRRSLSFFFATARNAFTTLGPFMIRRNVPQNNPTVVLTTRLSHEFRNNIDNPRANKVSPLTIRFRSGDDFDSLIDCRLYMGTSWVLFHETSTSCRVRGRGVQIIQPTLRFPQRPLRFTFNANSALTYSV